MTVDLEFSREAVGVKSKQNWTDSATFAIIGGQAERLHPDPAFVDLPEQVASDGVAGLRTTCHSFCLDMSKVLREFSDACAVLGSGTNEAVSNMDETERTSSKQFQELERRMSGGASG
ncbi:MAG: hypothetical protein Q4D96_14255 [Propionibacteriaceae bacterium]|nr:hypothetical protein [Propionibacteriaceae bacterium]